jgi:hypothetical protein
MRFLYFSRTARFKFIVVVFSQWTHGFDSSLDHIETEAGATVGRVGNGVRWME